MAKISIIMPIYNLEKYLSKSLDCVLSQTFKDFEVILVNDGSKDDSAKICDEYSEKDNRIKVIHKENEGSGPTRNRGIEVAIGEFMMFLDGDDLIEDNMLEKMYSTITENDLDLVICNHSTFNKDINDKVTKKSCGNYIVRGKNECRKTYVDLLKNELVQPPWNKIYRSAIIKNNNIRFPDLRRSQDAVFNCNYFEYVNSYEVIEDSLYNYRENDINLAWMKFPKEYFDICVTLNNIHLDAVERWSVLNDEARVFFSTYFIFDTIQCIRYSFSPRWNLSQKDRRAYINNIINNKKTRTSIKLSRQMNIFNKLMQKLIENKYTSIIIFFMKLDLFLRVRMNYIFKLLKKCL